MALALRQLDTSDVAFNEQIRNYIAQAQFSDTDVQNSVRSIIDAVRTRGDDAILEYTEQLDQLKAASVAELRIAPDKRSQLAAEVPPEWRVALE